MHYAIMIASYAVIGACLKYIDESFDDKRTRDLSYAASVVAGLLAGFVITDTLSFMIAVSLVIGTAITGKLDNKAFRVTIALALLSSFSISLFTLGPWVFLGLASLIAGTVLELGIISLTIPIMMTIFVAGDEVIDEIGHRKGLSYLNTRPLMKVLLLLFWLLGFFHVAYFVAFMLFDISYSAVGWVTNRRGLR